MEHPTMMIQSTVADTLTIDGLVSALYESISGPAGERDWPRLRSLFLPHATLSSTTLAPLPADAAHATLSVMTLDQFIEKNGPYFRTRDFHEKEIGRRVERWGHIAHVFSTYEIRQSVDPAFARGINSFQLFWDGMRWGIASLIWAAERPETPLPDVYLERTGSAPG